MKKDAILLFFFFVSLFDFSLFFARRDVSMTQCRWKNTSMPHMTSKSIDRHPVGVILSFFLSLLLSARETEQQKKEKKRKENNWIKAFFVLGWNVSWSFICWYHKLYCHLWEEMMPSTAVSGGISREQPHQLRIDRISRQLCGAKGKRGNWVKAAGR